MNPNLRWKSERMGKMVSVAFLVSLLVTGSFCPAWSGTIAGQDGVELRPLRGKDARKKVGSLGPGGDVADKVSPDVMQLIKKLLSGSDAERKGAEAKLISRGLRVVPELRSWIQQVNGKTEKIEIVLKKILRVVSGEQNSIDLVSRRSSAGHFFEQKLNEAQNHLSHGRYQVAREMAEAILHLDKSSPLRFLCRRLIRQAKEHKFKKELVTQVDAGALVYEVGEKPQIIFRILNKSGKRARFEVRQGIVGELYIVFDRCLFDGSHLTNSERVPLRIKGRQTEVVLKAEEGWECEIAYELPKDLPLRQVACRARIRVTFRPSRWEIEGDRDGNIPLSSEETEFWVIPPGKKRKLEDPLRRLKLALLLKQDEDIFIASWLCVWAGKKDPELNSRFHSVLIDNLVDIDPARKTLLYEILRQSSGMQFKRDVDWSDWWKEKAGEKSGP